MEVLSVTLSGIEMELEIVACFLSDVMKRLHELDCTEYVHDALDVVCHRREADFHLCTAEISNDFWLR